MFTLAIIIGIYSYLIFFLGILGLLYREYIFWISIIYVVIALTICWLNGFVKLLPTPSSRTPLRSRGYPLSGGVPALQAGWVKAQQNKVFFILVIVLALQVVVNLIGVLGPELAFDALWYHLTLPKLYLLSHTISYIPGGLLYYSAMPKLAEMLYIPALLFGGETFAKLIHFSFGLLTCIVLYKLSRKFFTPVLSLLAVIIFYANLVVDWESITAYIDLTRAFFEVLSIYAFVNFYTTQKRKWFVLSAILLGFAIATKVLAIGSMVILLVLLTYYGFKKKATLLSILSHNIFFALLALTIPLPWFIFSFINTGNPVYPFFTKTYAVTTTSALLNPITFVQSLWNLFVHSPDPLSPIYIMFLPLLVVLIIRSMRFTHLVSKAATPPKEEIFKLIVLYSVLSLFVWYVTPNTGGGRFIIPYLPIYSLLVVSIFTYDLQKWFKKMLFILIILTAIVSIGYRGVANKRYIPVIFGHETKQEFLTQNLNFNYGDFYDIDNYFVANIKPTDTVLLYGFHNLYYVDFPFIDSSYIRLGDTFTYIATQHVTISQRFASWQVIYQNNTTGVKLYALKRKAWVSY